LQLCDLERAGAAPGTKHREVILLVYLEGMAYQDVPAILKLSVGTVRSRLSRGPHAVRRLMEGNGEAHRRKLAWDA